jgi:hypothetical protein
MADEERTIREAQQAGEEAEQSRQDDGGHGGHEVADAPVIVSSPPSCNPDWNGK